VCAPVITWLALVDAICAGDSGPALVLQTGGAGDGSMWRDAGYVEALSTGYKCVLFDHRGHGLSDQPTRREAHSMERYVDDIVELLDQVGVERAGFWGYSQGGIIGLALGALHPERLTALLMTGAMETPDRKLHAAENLEGAEALRTHGWHPDGYRSEPEESVPAWFQRHFDSTNPEMLALWLDCEAEWDTWSLLSSVTVPVQMFVGDLEDPDHLNEKAAELMRYASVSRLEGLDHLDAFIRSDLVMPEATAFLARVVGH